MTMGSFNIRDKVRILRGEARGHHGTITNIEHGLFGTFYTVVLDAARVYHRNGRKVEIWEVRCKGNALQLIKEANR